MPERVELWWQRRRWSKGRDIPYRIGRFRSDWERYPALIRQFHPDLNAGITLTQIPPAADVYLVWECDAGHRFVATPEEQRMRPGRERRRSVWCPDCTSLAVPRRPPVVRPPLTAVITGVLSRERTTSQAETVTHVRLSKQPAQKQSSQRKPAREQRQQTQHPETAPATGRLTGPLPAAQIPEVSAGAERNFGRRHPVRSQETCSPGDAFVSANAPRPASSAEADLRSRLAARLDIDLEFTAIRVGQPFFGRLEVWPDIVLAELKVAIEYDTTGRHGLEHVGRRERVDRQKDRLARRVGWEIIRVRCGKLQSIGPYDLCVSGVSAKTVDRILETLCEIRGDLIIQAYLVVPVRGAIEEAVVGTR